MNWAYVAGSCAFASIVILWAIYQDYKLDKRLKLSDNVHTPRKPHLRIVRK